MYASFVDSKAAYDWVNRKWMFEILLNRTKEDDQENKTCWKVFKHYINVPYAKIMILNLEKEKTFLLKSDVRQGEIESPYLFNLYLDYVKGIFSMKCEGTKLSFEFNYRIHSKSSFQTRGKKQNMENETNMLLTKLNVDETSVVVMCESEKDLQQAMLLLNPTFKDFGLSLNRSKSETIILNYLGKPDNYPKSLCNIGSIDIQNVKNFKCLGNIFTLFNSNVTDEELFNTKTAAEIRIGEFMTFFSNNHLHMKIKLLFYNYYVRNKTMIHGTYLEFKSKKQRKQLKIFHIKLLQQLVKNGNKQKSDYCSFIYTNQKFLQITRSSTLTQFIEHLQTKGMDTAYDPTIMEISNSNFLKIKKKEKKAKELDYLKKT